MCESRAFQWYRIQLYKTKRTAATSVGNVEKTVCSCRREVRRENFWTIFLQPAVTISERGHSSLLSGPPWSMEGPLGAQGPLGAPSPYLFLLPWHSKHKITLDHIYLRDTTLRSKNILHRPPEIHFCPHSCIRITATHLQSLLAGFIVKNLTMCSGSCDKGPH